MLENPWKELERQREAKLAASVDYGTDDGDGNALSDSLVAQVGDSILERAAKTINPAPEVAEPDMTSPEVAEEFGEKPLSDSMVPLVGDSIVGAASDQSAMSVEAEETSNDQE